MKEHVPCSEMRSAMAVLENMVLQFQEGEVCCGELRAPSRKQQRQQQHAKFKNRNCRESCEL